MENNKNIKAIILAAGEGTRLRPYTLEKPKCLVEVDNKSLLDRQLSVLSSSGVTSIVIIGGYKAEMLQRDGIDLKINPRYAETNMVWTLFCAEGELEGDVIISYGDIVYSQEVLQSLLASDADIAVAIDLEWESYWRARNEEPLDDAETLKMHPDGRIYEIGNKPKSLGEIEGQYMGLIKVTQEGVNGLKSVFQKAHDAEGLLGKPVENAYMTDLLQAMINANYSVQSVPVKAGWVEVDTVSDLHSTTTKNRLLKIEEAIV
jgi:choline kinase